MWVPGFGEASQEKLKDATALVSRCGGLGGPLCYSLAAAGLGALYLIIGIGLYGQSRFALFMAIIIPMAGAWLALRTTGLAALNPLGLSQLAIALIVVLGSAAVLFTVRHNASV